MSSKKTLYRSLLGKGSIFIRFRNINIALFSAVFFVMVIVMAAADNRIIRRISTDYAGHYAVSSADALSAHIVKAFGLMSQSVRSAAVVDWLTDDDNDVKKRFAYEKMSDIIGKLYSNNLYVGVEKTLREYRIDNDYAAGNIRPFAVLDRNDPDDAWYFKCIASEGEYVLNVGIDQVLQKKRVWVNYRIAQNGIPLGVVATGLEFSHIAGELFAQYDNKALRGLIIDENGIVNIDSALLDDEDYLYFDYKAPFNEMFSDTALLAAVESHLGGIKGNFAGPDNPVVVELSTGPYRYATIAPIRYTNWTAVIFYDPSSSLSMSLFLPTTAILLVLLITFAFAANATSYRLIFIPLEKLVRSLARLKDDNDEGIYGIERDDEIGNLSNTILDLFTKANYDALTGIYNRRYLEKSFQSTMELLARSGGFLSVLMMDVDFFKKYNDTYGHEQGDVCLRTVAQALTGGIMRANDFVARYGGEEFIAVLPNTDEAGARMVAEKLLENVRNLNIPHTSSAVAQHVTVSIGVATGKVVHTQGWEEYIKRADGALYMSKQNGRNRYMFLDF